MVGNDKIGFDALDKAPVPPRYRVLILDHDGRVLRMEPIHVNTDHEAINCARALVDGHAVELWDGVRYIEHFPSIG